MGVLTDTSVIPPAVRAKFDRQLLKRALPMLVHQRVTTRRPLSQRSGDTMVFRRLPALPTATVPLTEGVPPGGNAIGHADISVRIQQWGSYVTIADLIRVTIDHPLLNDANKLLGEQAAQTTDELTRNVLVTGTSVFYGGGETSRSGIVGVGQKPDKAIIDRAVRYLDAQNAMRFTKMIRASVKISTFPIRPAFWALCHTDLLFTLREIAGWIGVEEYAGEQEVMATERGSIGDVRFCCSTKCQVWRGGGGASDTTDVQVTGGNADVYAILIMGEDAAATVPLEGESLQNIIKPIGSGGPTDPLNQIGTSGWKHTGARIILDNTFMTRLEVSCGKNEP